ncbi:MAG: 30S ribosomal protein S20 [Chloroflexi bacterium]|nr:30S ribosomal protein S20 [Chloroflexota bacterium]
MPVTKSAQKQVRVSEKKRLRNKSVRTRCKTEITKAEKLIFSSELESADKAVSTAISALDKAAEKGIIPANNAARRKSRLLKKLNQARGSSAPEAQPDEPEEASTE